MLTPEQLEAAARKLCEIRGIDPDERCENETRHDEFISTTIAYFAWEECAEEIRAYLEIQEAVRYVINQTTCAEGNRLDLHRTRDGVYLPCLPDCDAPHQAVL